MAAIGGAPEVLINVECKACVPLAAHCRVFHWPHWPALDSSSPAPTHTHPVEAPAQLHAPHPPRCLLSKCRLAGHARKCSRSRSPSCRSRSGSCSLESEGGEGFEGTYNAHIPGRVVLIYRQDAGGSAGSGSGGGSGGATATANALAALVGCQHPAVRRLRVSSRMVTDHFVDTEDVIAALGG